MRLGRPITPRHDTPEKAALEAISTYIDLTGPARNSALYGASLHVGNPRTFTRAQRLKASEAISWHLTACPGCGDCEKLKEYAETARLTIKIGRRFAIHYTERATALGLAEHRDDMGRPTQRIHDYPRELEHALHALLASGELCVWRRDNPVTRLEDRYVVRARVPARSQNAIIVTRD